MIVFPLYIIKVKFLGKQRQYFYSEIFDLYYDISSSAIKIIFITNYKVI